MRILRDNRKESGWITAIINDRWVEAKVYDEPSIYGVNNGRVSKIAISKTACRNVGENFFDQMCYHYDRGLDFCETDEKLVNEIVAELEGLPKVF